MILPISELNGLNLYINPVNQEAGDLIRAVNVDSFPLGAKTKRDGYSTLLGTANGSAINTLFQWIKNDGTSNFLYRASGDKLYYYNEGAGTGDWAVCGNGTIGAGAHIGQAVLDDTLIICDGVGSTRHTTNGTSFTDTTLAPIAVDLEMYQNRIYAAGTSSTLFYSTAGSANNWALSGTGDSSSFTVPGGGRISCLLKQNDRLNIGKTSGQLFKWDGFNLVDTATNLAPTSPYSITNIEGFAFWLNRLGHYGYGGVNPQLLSNAVQRQIYNSAGGGIAGTTFDTAPAAVHHFNYYLSIGTVTDDLTNETIPDAVLKYDFQKNEYLNYKYYNFPTAYLAYKDRSGNDQLAFGDSAGQVYKTSGTLLADNGQPIESIIEFVVHGGPSVAALDKKWNHFWAFFNPGNQVRVQVAYADTYVKEGLRWLDVGDFSTGMGYYRFPSDPTTNQSPRSKFLFVKIVDSSTSNKFSFYGAFIDLEVMEVF